MFGFLDFFWRLFTPPAPRTMRTFDESPAPGSRLYVGNLSYSAKEEQLKDLFSRFGQTRHIDLIRDRFTRRLKGYAFVEMASGDGARRALELNGTEFLGRKIVVSEAKSKGAQGQQQGGHQDGQQPGQGHGGGGGGRRRRGGRRHHGGGSGDRGGGRPEKPRLQRYE